MSCNDVASVLDTHRTARLAPAERAKIDAHLAACPDCVHYLDSYKTTITLGKSICDPEDADAPVPDDVPEELVQAVIAARRLR